MRVWSACLLGTLLIGCGASAVGDPRANLELMRREHTADKLVDRGTAFAEMGDLTRAEQYLVAALDQGAQPRRALTALLRVCVAAGRHRAAIVYAREYGAELSNDAQFEFILALLESAMGEPDAAIDHLRGVVRRAPSHAEAHYRLAALLEERDSDRGEVAFHLHEYLRLEPKGKYAEAASTALQPESSTGLRR